MELLGLPAPAGAATRSKRRRQGGLQVPPAPAKRTRGANGSSCLPCQQAKRRCDGNRPCGRCRRQRIQCKLGDAARRHAELRRALRAQGAHAEAERAGSAETCCGAGGAGSLVPPQLLCITEPGSGAWDPLRAGDAALDCAASTAGSVASDGSGLALGARSGQGPTRFNAGAFLLAQDVGVEPCLLAQRLEKLLTHADNGTLLRTLGVAQRRGGLPLRLLAPLAPWLPALLARRMAGLAGRSPLADLAPALSFDGAHLGVAGLAAALLAWAHDDSVVQVPLGYRVVLAPVGRHHGNGAQSPLPPHPEDGFANCPCVPLAALFARWPHLPAAFAASGAEGDADVFLGELRAGRAAAPGQALCALLAAHNNRSGVPQVVVVFPPAGGLPFFKSMSPLAQRALGQALPRMAPNGVDKAAHQPEDGNACTMARFLHPDCLLRRTLAFLAAANVGHASFQVEARFLRTLPATRGPGAASAPAQRRAFSSLYAVETVHVERHPCGRLLSVTSALSDAVVSAAPLALRGTAFRDAQLDAIQQVVLAQQAPLEVALACRRLGLPRALVLGSCVVDKEGAKLFMALAKLALAQGPLSVLCDCPGGACPQPVALSRAQLAGTPGAEAALSRCAATRAALRAALPAAAQAQLGRLVGTFAAQVAASGQALTLAAASGSVTVRNPLGGLVTALHAGTKPGAAAVAAAQ